MPPDDNVLFLEVTVGDPSEFTDKLTVKGVQVGNYCILRLDGPAVPNAIAAFLLYVRDYTGKLPHAYFGWSEGNPIYYLVRFYLIWRGRYCPVARVKCCARPSATPNITRSFM